MPFNLFWPDASGCSAYFTNFADDNYLYFALQQSAEGEIPTPGVLLILRGF